MTHNHKKSSQPKLTLRWPRCWIKQTETFKSAITNSFKELTQIMFKELKENTFRTKRKCGSNE